MASEHDAAPHSRDHHDRPRRITAARRAAGPAARSRVRLGAGGGGADTRRRRFSVRRTIWRASSARSTSTGTGARMPGQQPVVVFEIARNGQISKLAIEKSSGNPYYDQQAAPRDHRRQSVAAAARRVLGARCSGSTSASTSLRIEADRMTLRRIVALVLVLLVIVLPGPAPVMTPPRGRRPGRRRLPQRHRRRHQEAQHRHPRLHGRGGADAAGNGKQLAAVIGRRSHASPASSAWSPPPDPSRPTTPRRSARSWSDFAAAGAHAGLHGLLTMRGDRLEVGDAALRPDLPGPPAHRHARSSRCRPRPVRRLAHKIADEVVLQFTGERGIADTKLAFVSGPRGAKEIVRRRLRRGRRRPGDAERLASISRRCGVPTRARWPSPRSRRAIPISTGSFPFERRPEQMLSAFAGINSSPAWSPDGRTWPSRCRRTATRRSTCSPSATGALRRLTRHAGIDTEPTWSPAGQQIAFVSDRAGAPHIFVMDRRAATCASSPTAGFHTQPRWSPQGDAIAYTQRERTPRHLGRQRRRLEPAPADQRPATTRAPRGRPTDVISRSSRIARGAGRSSRCSPTACRASRSRRARATHSPSWSPRLP